MDIRKIRKLIDLVDETGVNELEVQEGEARVKIVRYSETAAPVAQVVKSSHVIEAQPPVIAKPNVTLEPKSTWHPVKSPMVGTFYLSASPEAGPFVAVGQSVKVGDVLCIVEAMKMFNHIEADRAGVIRECAVADGRAVEYGQVLFYIEPA